MLASIFALGGASLALAQDETPATPTPEPEADALELEFTELSDSGISGTATLYDHGEETLVEIDVEGAGEEHPTHVHIGTCDMLEPIPEYDLESVGEDGESVTLIDVSLNELLDDEFAIDMHLAPDQLGVLIACADIEGEPESVATPVATPEEATPTPEDPTPTPEEPEDPTPTPEPEEPTPTPEDPEEPTPAPEDPTPTPEEPEDPTPTPTPEEPTPDPDVDVDPTPTIDPAAELRPKEPSDPGDGTGGPINGVVEVVPPELVEPEPTPVEPGKGVALPPGPPDDPSDGTAGVQADGPVTLPPSTLPAEAGTGHGLFAAAEDTGLLAVWVSVALALASGAAGLLIRRHAISSPRRRW